MRSCVEKKLEQENFEELLIKTIKDKGNKHPESKKLLLAWTIKKEEEFETATPKERIQFDIQRARLYKKAGLKESALESFEAAKMCAQMYDIKLFHEIEKEMKL